MDDCVGKWLELGVGQSSLDIPNGRLMRVWLDGAFSILWAEGTGSTKQKETEDT